jgi:branched-chain amino acid transport system substrate-binding protein
MLGAAAGALTVGSLRRAALAQAAGGTIKVPLLLTLSGPAAPFGTNAKIGADIAVALLNKAGGINGRNVEPIYMDDKGRPADAVAVAREAIGEGYKLLAGTLLSPNMLAQIPLLAENKTVLIALGGTSMSLSHESYSPYFFPGLENDYQRNRMFAKFAAERLPNVSSWGALLSETKAYIDGYQTFRKFAKEDYAAKGKTTKYTDAQLFKLGTQDFRTQLSQIAASDVDAVYNLVVGGDGLTMWQQAQSFALNNKIKAVIDQTIDFMPAKVLKKRLPANLWTIPIGYAPAQGDNPRTKAFYGEYVARTKDELPAGHIYYGDQAISIVSQVLMQTGGSVDSEKTIPVLESATFQTAIGPIRYRKEDHVLLKDMVMTHIAGNDTELGVEVKEWVKLSSADFLLPPNPGKPSPVFE